MAENEITALIAQLRKVLKLTKEAQPPISDAEHLEFRTALTMMENLFGHRGPDYEITQAQALELATVLGELRQLHEAKGIKVEREETLALVDRLMNAPKPVKN